MKVRFVSIPYFGGSFLVLLNLLLLTSFSCSQNLLNQPESIVYDALHKRYLISNYSTGDIVQVDSAGNQSYFVQGMNAIQGLEISGNAVYVGAGQMVRGFELDSGKMIMDIHVPNVANLNDVTSDTSGNLYVSDVFGTKIIKINISSGSYSVFVDGSGIYRPNGIFYDKEFNRILVCSYRVNSPIQAINLADSSVTTVVNSSISLCDGITKDRNGNCYVTSWSTYTIYRYDPLFTQPPEIFYTNSCGPADIFYDSVNNVIAVPLMQCNSWTTVAVPIGIKKTESEVPESYYLYQNYPNPFNPFTKIKFDVVLNSRLRRNDNVILKIHDVIGREIITLVNEELKPGTYEVVWDGRKYPSGVYFYKLVSGDFIETKKMVLMK